MHHFLIIPKSDVPDLQSLTSDHIHLLEQMENEAFSVINRYIYIYIYIHWIHVHYKSEPVALISQSHIISQSQTLMWVRGVGAPPPPIISKRLNLQGYSSWLAEITFFFTTVIERYWFQYQSYNQALKFAVSRYPWILDFSFGYWISQVHYPNGIPRKFRLRTRFRIRAPKQLRVFLLGHNVA